ncbi:MAG: cysteine desulfurase [Lactobacillales bacterium]|jgi:cysteine desulfurase|nr:cysteine desulfurase [Lactobacillales bacterium]
MNETNYFDHAGTTPMDPEVVQVMSEVLSHHFGNPSSIHKFGRDAYHLISAARKIIADSIFAKESEIIFTSGGVEGNNMAIISTALQNQDKGKHLIATAIEHPSVLRTMKFLENQFGFEVTFLPVDDKGNISIEMFKKVLRVDTILVSVMFVNNETGVKLPIEEIGEILRTHPAIFHTDAVQAIGLLQIHPAKLGIDLLSVTAHKLNGPKGVGFLYKRENLLLNSFMHGGEQESGRRAGTENVAGIVGLQKAMELLNVEEKQRRLKEYNNFQELLLKKLDQEKVVYRINGDLGSHLPHILNLHLKNVSSNLALVRLDLKGFAVSAGSACTAGAITPSHVLTAMYGENHLALKEGLRISFGSGNTREQVKELAAELTALARNQL